MLDIAAYGASPSATPAQNRTAIQAAFTAALTQGGAVYAPAGVYRIAVPPTGTLAVALAAGPIRVLGDGPRATVFQFEPPVPLAFAYEGIRVTGTGSGGFRLEEISLQAIQPGETLQPNHSDR